MPTREVGSNTVVLHALGHYNVCLHRLEKGSAFQRVQYLSFLEKDPNWIRSPASFMLKPVGIKDVVTATPSCWDTASPSIAAYIPGSIAHAAGAPPAVMR